MRILLFCLFCCPVFAQNTWVKVLDQEGKKHFPHSLIVNQEGNIVVAGIKRNDTEPYELQPFFSSFTEEGDVLWFRSFDWEELVLIWKIIELGNGDLAALYSTTEIQFNNPVYLDYRLMRLTGDGTPLWSIKLKNYTAQMPTFIAAEDDLIVRFYPQGYFDNYILRIDPSGDVIWAKCLKNQESTDGRRKEE